MLKEYLQQTNPELLEFIDAVIDRRFMVDIEDIHGNTINVNLQTGKIRIDLKDTGGTLYFEPDPDNPDGWIIEDQEGNKHKVSKGETISLPGYDQSITVDKNGNIKLHLSADNEIIVDRNGQIMSPSDTLTTAPSLIRLAFTLAASKQQSDC